MLIGKNYTYLELQKSGSSFVKRLLMTLDPDVIDYPKHISFSKIEKRGILLHKDRVISNIRNPWSWYVSLWSYGCQGQGGFYKRKPKETWQHLYADVNKPELFKKWLNRVLWGSANEWMEGFQDVVWNKQVGFYTYRYLKLGCRNLNSIAKEPASMSTLEQYLDTNDIRTHYFKTEGLTDDILNHASLFNLEKKDVRSYIASLSRKTNESKHLPTAAYYDDESFQWVFDKDALICKKFEYFEIPEYE